jgi:phosphoribosylformylglycinamidine cyclo-ligase
VSNTYASAGVDVAAGDRAVELLKNRINQGLGKSVIGGLGGFAALFDANDLKQMRSPLLVTATDGVGTKTEIARLLGSYSTIGLDLVAMVADDVVTTGARPLFMTDYLAVGKVVPEVVAEIVGGVQDGCRLIGCDLVGGETAEHPGLMEPDAFDLAGAMTGVVEADALLGAQRVRAGDSAIAISSSGVHANGMSLARRVFLSGDGLAIDTHLPELGQSVGEALLTPTAIYAAAILKLLALDSIDVHALAHITGGGLVANLIRVLPNGVHIKVNRDSWALPPIFRELARRGQIEQSEMEQTFNQGIGMVMLVSEESTAASIQFLASEGFDAWQVGVVESTRPDQIGSAEMVGAYRR